MKAIEQLKAKLESMGATLDDSSGYTLNCDAPAGKCNICKNGLAGKIGSAKLHP